MRAAGRDGLTFRWPDRRRFSFMLAGFIALSAAGHALAFYIFQVVYPPTASITPAPVQVSLATPQTIDDAELFRWLEAEDPARAAVPRELHPQELAEVKYRPSFAELQTLPRSAPTPKSTKAYPVVRSALDIVQGRGERRAPAPVVRKTKTLVRFLGDLRQREAAARPPVVLEKKSDAPLQPARFLAGVNDRGEVQFAFLQHSSGDAAVDRQADAHVRSLLLAPREGEITWGFVEYAWGSDAFALNEEEQEAP